MNIFPETEQADAMPTLEGKVMLDLIDLLATYLVTAWSKARKRSPSPFPLAKFCCWHFHIFGDHQSADHSNAARAQITDSLVDVR